MIFGYVYKLQPNPKQAHEQYGLIIKQVRRDSAKPKNTDIQLSLNISILETPSTELTVVKRSYSGARKSKNQEPGNLKQLDLFQDILAQS